MGLFERLANHWTPAYEYREYYGNEMEAIAWECTAVGSRRGFLLGVAAGALLTVAVIGGAVMTGLYPPPATTASQITSGELAAVREENHALKAQVMGAKAAAICPPSPRPGLTKAQPPTQAVAAPPQPATQAPPRAAARRKASVTGPSDQAALPIPSTCRREGDCE